MNLKIGILGSRGIPNAYGGFEECAQHLAQGLTRRGHEVFVYNSSLHPYKDNTWNGVHIIHCKDWENRLGAAGQFIYDFNCFIDSRKRNYDVLLQLGYTSNSVWHRLWPKEAVNIVNMDGLEWKRTQYSKPVRWFIKKAEALAALHADYMVADSLGIQQHILNSYSKPSAFIPYAAEICTEPEAEWLNQFGLKPYRYYLVVSRLEPENNVEMVIEGFLKSKKDGELVIVGSMNKFGRKWQTKYVDRKIRFLGGIYDKNLLNNLRYFSRLHFHGHSVGGTNPSLLEAMACQCNIAAHDNVFNKTVLSSEAEYFSSSDEVASILNSENYKLESAKRKESNTRKIIEVYNWEKIVDAYENIMYALTGTKAKKLSCSEVRQIA